MSNTFKATAVVLSYIITSAIATILINAFAGPTLALMALAPIMICALFVMMIVIDLTI